jgi:hypothetical protein
LDEQPDIFTLVTELLTMANVLHIEGKWEQDGFGATLDVRCFTAFVDSVEESETRKGAFYWSIVNKNWEGLVFFDGYDKDLAAAKKAALASFPEVVRQSALLALGYLDVTDVGEIAWAKYRQTLSEAAPVNSKAPAPEPGVADGLVWKDFPGGRTLVSACGRTKAPPGWTCKRHIDHEGPCAAIPDDGLTDMSEYGWDMEKKS